MTLRVLHADERDAAAALLAAGSVVAIPTDTVYGLAAVPRDDPVATLFAAKHRPTGVPVAVLCATTATARDVAARFDARAESLAAAFWPGPLTLVVPAPATFAALLGGTDGVGLRVPDDATCAGLLAVTGPLAVTSANRHGAAPATSAAAVRAAFDDEPRVAAVLDAGSRDGAVSTVVDLRADPVVVVREGALRVATVLAVLSEG